MRCSLSEVTLQIRENAWRLPHVPSRGQHTQRGGKFVTHVVGVRSWSLGERKGVRVPSGKVPITFERQVFFSVDLPCQTGRLLSPHLCEVDTLTFEIGLPCTFRHTSAPQDPR